MTNDTLSVLDKIITGPRWTREPINTLSYYTLVRTKQCGGIAN